MRLHVVWLPFRPPCPMRRGPRDVQGKGRWTQQRATSTRSQLFISFPQCAAGEPPPELAEQADVVGTAAMTGVPG